MDANFVRCQCAATVGSSPPVPLGTYSLLLKGFATATHASPKITLSLLKVDIVTTNYQILAGVATR